MESAVPVSTKIYKVSELNFEIKNNIESTYSNIWIEGEISNFAYPNKKHMYFSLVDEHSTIKVAMFENNCRNLIFNPEDGLHVYVNGYVSIYDKRSEYQIIAYDVIPVKKGNLLIAFEQLKEKLRSLGLFDEENKKSIPLLPSRIGVITSKSGAVIRDIVKILNKRYDNYHLIIRNTPVQGNEAAQEICRAIDDFEEYGVNVIIIARGGGSFEDLAPFNNEDLAGRIFKCEIPIISGVGHQTDFTICDFVSDKRAATPTHAAELVILNKQEEKQKIHKNIRKLFNLITQKLFLYKRELNFLRQRKIFMHPETILNPLWQEYDDMNRSLKNNCRNLVKINENKFKIINAKVSLKNLTGKISSRKTFLNNRFIFLKNNLNSILVFKRNRLEVIIEKMSSSNPVNILKRGFSIVKNKKTHKIIKSINDINIDELALIFLKDGSLQSKIIRKDSCSIKDFRFD
ncbi:MAG: exodeoxyribonuclease VII large subunit [Actinobacteria bacterium]|nr:exodeoxyribonuclease VII large subunit [Cyanobacteriota bacterium]MCL6087634.1 exodeoxyribonuclease VII large subunit [Actinomycetota bacterium]